MSFDFNKILTYLLLSPSAVIMLVTAIAGGGWLTSKQITEHQTNWIETTATLEKISIESRGVKPEFYTRATYVLLVNDQKVKAFSTETFPTRDLAEDRVRLIKEYKEKTQVFYDQSNPSDNTFSLDEVQTSWSPYFMVMAVLLGMGLYAVWIMKKRHEYYGQG